MVLSRRYDDITVREIVAEAGVARSTFYDHYPDKRAVLLASMEHIINTLTQCAAGNASRDQVEQLVNHLWKNRSLGRRIFQSNASRPLIGALAESIQQATGQTQLASSALANGYIGTLTSWFSGELSAPTDTVTDWLAGEGKLSDRNSRS